MFTLFGLPNASLSQVLALIRYLHLSFEQTLTELDSTRDPEAKGEPNAVREVSNGIFTFKKKF